MDRRQFLAGAGAAAVAWTQVGRIHPANAADGPPSFPTHIDVYRQTFENWSRELIVDDLWTCTPTSADEVAELATWAKSQGWALRARGHMHGWSPLLITPDTDRNTNVVLVDTSALVDMSIEGDGDGIRVGAGVLLVDILTELEEHGLGIISVPAVGDVTIGGMLAIGAHGAAIPADGETTPTNGSYGSFSHLVRELTAIVWSQKQHRYVPETFVRGDHEALALATSLGRSFITEVVLDAAPLDNLRCVSYVDIPATELFGTDPEGRTMASFFADAGRAEALWYPFTDNPWLKVWEVAPERPLTSRPTDQPYNYPFSDQIPLEMATLASDLVTGSPEATPVFGQSVYAFTVAGLAATASFDLWGPAKNTQLYVQGTTLRVRELGLAVLTSRDQVQHVIHTVTTKFSEMLGGYAAEGKYPVNMPLEIRASGLDNDLGDAPILSATSPDPSAPHLDTVLFMNVLTLTGTAHADEFVAEYEQFVRSAFDPDVARLRPEWSKTFAFTADGASTDTNALDDIRQKFTYPGLPKKSFDRAVKILDHLDPHRVFTNSFLDDLLS